MELSGTFAKITTVADVTLEQVIGLLVGIMENGYSPWLRRIKSHKFAKGLCHNDFKLGGKMQPEDYYAPVQLIPVTAGCSSVWVVDDENGEEDEDTKEVTVGIPELKKGLQILADKYPHEFRNLMEGNDDANTADLFGQCVVYGQEVFS